MASLAERPKSDTTISIRIPLQTRDLIDTAAASLGKSRSEFMIESARRQAQDVLLDQRIFDLDAEASAAFAAVLAEPPKANAALRALMQAKSPWE